MREDDDGERESERAPKEIGKSDIYAAHKSSAFGRGGKERKDDGRHSPEIGVKAMRIHPGLLAKETFGLDRELQTCKNRRRLGCVFPRPGCLWPWGQVHAT